VVLSAQATDAGVNRATRPLFAAVDTPEKMLALGEAGVVQAIKSVGLFNTKAKNVIALSRILVDQHGGEVPREREACRTFRALGARRRMWS
jgi:endonuclease-3